MRPTVALRRGLTVDTRLIAVVAIMCLAIALLASQGAIVAPRSLEPVQPNVTPAVTAQPAIPSARPADTVAPTAAPIATTGPSSPPLASPQATAAPAQQVPTGGAPQDRGGAVPQERPGYGANGPAIVEPGGSRQITDDPPPPKVILPKGSMGQ